MQHSVMNNGYIAYFSLLMSSCVCICLTCRYCINIRLNEVSRKQRHTIAQGF